MIWEVAGETEKSSNTCLPFLFLLSTVILDQSIVDEDADIREAYSCFYQAGTKEPFHRGLLCKTIENHRYLYNDSKWYKMTVTK